jgi:Glycosyltransferase family 87
MPLSPTSEPRQVSSTARGAMAATLVLSGLAFQVCFGIIGFGRGGGRNQDGAALYAAGKTWIAGANPYDHENLLQSVRGTGINLTDVFFFYPPQSAALVVPLAPFDYSTALLIWLTVNLIAIAAILVLVVRSAEPVSTFTGTWLLAALFLGSPFTAHVVWTGQTSLVAFAATYGAWFFSRRERWVQAGLCLGIATFKPQICILLLLWFFLQRSWKILAVASATIAAMSAYPVFMRGPLGMMVEWQRGLADNYSSLVFNQPSFEHVIGLQALLNSVGIRVPDLLWAGALGTVVLWMFQAKILAEFIPGILFALTFVFVGHLHDYDYAGLVFVFAPLLVHTARNAVAFRSVLSLILLLYVPQRLVRLFYIPALNHWRELLVVVLLCMLVHFSREERKYVASDPLSASG